MSDKLVLGLIIVSIFLLVVVLIILRKGRIPTKYALLWLVPSIVILSLVVFPDLFLFFTQLFGFQTISNLIIGVLFVLLFFVIIALTVIIAGQTTKINLLIQEVSILKSNDNNRK